MMTCPHLAQNVVKVLVLCWYLVLICPQGLPLPQVKGEVPGDGALLGGRRGGLPAALRICCISAERCLLPPLGVLLGAPPHDRAGTRLIMPLLCGGRWHGVDLPAYICR